MTDAAVAPNCLAGVRVLDLSQFEAGPSQVKKGIVRDLGIQSAVCDDIARFVASLGWTVLGIIPSPILGGDGNREFLIGAREGE